MAETLRVGVDQIIDAIHTRYAKQTAALVQENAELAAGQDMLLAENAELKARLAAVSAPVEQVQL